MPIVDLQKEREIVTRGRERGMTDDEIKQAVLLFRSKSQNQPQQAEPTQSGESGGFLSSVGGDIVERGKNIGNVIGQSARGEINPVSGSLQIVGQAAGGIGDITGEAISSILPMSAKEALGGALSSVLGFGPIANTIDLYEQFASKHPEAAKNLEALVNIGMLAGDVAAVRGVGSAVKGVAKTTAKTASRAVSSGMEAVGPSVKSAADTASRAIGETLGSASRTIGSIPSRVEANVVAAQRAREAIQALPEGTAQRAVINGVAPRDVQLILGLSEDEAKIAKNMVKSAEEYATTRRATDPAKIVGAELEKRISAIAKIGDDANDVLKQYAARLGTQTIDDVVPSVVDKLRSVPGLDGLSIDANGILDFSRTTLASSQNASARKTLQKIVSELSGKDALQLHNYRKELFEILGGRKKSLAYLTDTEDKAINAIRSGITDSIENVSEGYRLANKSVAEIIDLENQFNSFFKGVGDSASIREARGAKLMRRLTSNAPSSDALESLLQKTEEVLAKNGIQFGTDMTTLQEVYNALSRYFDVVKDTSLAGQVRLGAGRGGIIGTATDIAEKVVGKSDAVVQSAIKDLIEGLAK